MLRLLFLLPILSLASIEQTICSSVLLVQEQAEGYDKFHDPIGCTSAEAANGCDVLNCRLCKRNSEDPNTTKCPMERISNRILTPEQQHAMDVVGISTLQMNLILDSVYGCVLEDVYPTELSTQVLQGLDTYCQDHLSPGHEQNGISSFYSPHCAGQPGCIAALLMHRDGGCRYCRIRNSNCINDCDPSWIEC